MNIPTQVATSQVLLFPRPVKPYWWRTPGLGTSVDSHCRTFSAVEQVWLSVATPPGGRCGLAWMKPHPPALKAGRLSIWHEHSTTSRHNLTKHRDLIVSGDHNSSLVIAGAVDNVNVQFCLPCNFEHLQLNVTQFVLNYKNQTRIYLRQPQNLTIQVSAC